MKDGTVEIVDKGAKADCDSIREMNWCQRTIDFGSCIGPLANARDCCPKTCFEFELGDKGGKKDCEDVVAMGWCKSYINFGTCVGKTSYGSTCCEKSCKEPTTTPPPPPLDVPPIPTTTEIPCTDTPGWSDPSKFTCSDYERLQCSGGQFIPGKEDSEGPVNNYPERNCCACGKASMPEIQPARCTESYQADWCETFGKTITTDEANMCKTDTCKADSDQATCCFNMVKSEDKGMAEDCAMVAQNPAKMCKERIEKGLCKGDLVFGQDCCPKTCAMLGNFVASI